MALTPVFSPACPSVCRAGALLLPAQDIVIWAAVLLGSAACYALKAPARRPRTSPRQASRGPTGRDVPGGLPAALLAVVTLGDGMAIVVDARVAAVAAAAVALALRAPFLVVVVVGAGPQP